MKSISFITPDLKRLDTIESDVLALFLFSERRPLQGITSLIDWRFHGHLSRLIIDGFLTGERGETLLMPTGGRLRQQCLLVFGLGNRGDFGKRVFKEAVAKMLKVARDLDFKKMILSLPGRVENTCEGKDAMEWLLSCCEEQADEPDIFIIEPTDTQKGMLPIAARWRLKQLVPLQPYSDG